MFAPQKDWAEKRKTTTAMGQSAAPLARLQLLPASPPPLFDDHWHAIEARIVRLTLHAGRRSGGAVQLKCAWLDQLPCTLC